MKRVVLLAALALSLSAISPSRAYVHPGAPLTLADLQAVKANVNNNRQPWKSGYDALATDSHSSLSYTMQGPFANVSRSPDVNLTQWRSDMIAIWNLSLMWWFTGNTAYAQKAHDILLSWANTQTSFTGGESMLDLGDYAYKFVGGADILRGTWSGWTSADTTTVQAYFGNILLPATNPYGDSMYGAANKGALALVAGGLLAIFDDDTTTLNKIVYQLRTLAHIGLRSSDDIGLIGDSLRDQGHAHGQLFSLLMLAEALWKQGVDVYGDYNNRLLTDSEYFARVNDLVTTPFLPFGTTDAYYTADNTTHGWNGGNNALTLAYSAYVVRKGLPAPCTTHRLRELPVDQNTFVFLKDADPSTATPAAALTFPATASVSSGFSDTDIGGSTPAGSSSYSGGLWTVKGAGTDIWSTSDSCHFTYQALTGDFAIVAKVESISGPVNSEKAGVMLRSSLTSGSTRAWMAVTSKSTVEQNFQGLAVYGGSNYGTKSLSITQNGTYWVKLERLSNIITGYISQDGTNWAAVDVGRYDSIPNTLYVGLVVCSVSNGNLATGVFSHVQITGGDGGAPVVAPAAPAALLASGGENVATLNWQSSFGATSYTIGRATTSGGPYTTIASGVTTSSYIDTTVTNGTTYYYVVNAVNSAGTSGNSPEDIATPQAPMVNVAVGGAPNSDDYNTGSQGPAMAFDSNSNTKWYHGAAAPAWIQYDFGSGVSQTIKRYTITSASDVPQRDPAAWQFQGSNDGSTWTTLDTQSNQVFPMRQQTLTYNVAQPAAYRYYRLNVTANSGGSGYGVQLSELGLFTDQGRTILNGTYRVLNYKSGKALDLSGGNTGNGTQTVQWTYGTANSQKWTFTDQGNGQYQVMNVASGTVLDVSGGSTSDLANLIIWPWSGATNQQWQVIPCGGGCYRLTSVKSGKVADVTNGSTADGATVIQYHINGGTNQEWSISVAP